MLKELHFRGTAVVICSVRRLVFNFMYLCQTSMMNANPIPKLPVSMQFPMLPFCPEKKTPETRSDRCDDNPRNKTPEDPSDPMLDGKRGQEWKQVDTIHASPDPENKKDKKEKYAKHAIIHKPQTRIPAATPPKPNPGALSTSTLPIQRSHEPLKRSPLVGVALATAATGSAKP